MTLAQRLYLTSKLGCLLLLGSLHAAANNFEEASKYFKQAKYDQALGEVNNCLSQNPKDAQARFLKGLILTQQDKTDAAIQEFSALTADYPNLPEPLNNLAVLYANRGQYDKAKQALEMAIRTNPSYATAHENLGDIYARMASQAYDRALKLDHDNSATQTKLAMVQGLFNDAHKPASSAVSTAANPTTTPGKTVEPPISKPATNRTAAVASADANAEVLKAIKEWAAAWSAKNVRKYLSFYAPDFKIPTSESRAEWEASRAARISKPKAIHVGIANPDVTLSDASHATVTFNQSYSASHLKTSIHKTLLMKKSDARWLIEEERVR